MTPFLVSLPSPAQPGNVTTQPEKGQKTEQAALREAATSFEAVFMRQLFRVMRSSVRQDGLFEESYARQMYEEMRDDLLADEMAKSGGIGLADLLVKSWTVRGS